VTDDSHPDAETLALFIEGKLARKDVKALFVHVDVCTPCMRALRGANDDVSRRAPASRSPLFLAAAAAVVIALAGGAVLVRKWRHASEPPMARLVALASADARNVEPRLSGGFRWAPYRGPLRANGDPNDAAPDARTYRIAGVTGELLERAQREDAIAVQQAAGAALVLVGRPADAIAKLRAAAEREPRNAALRNDLGAAEYIGALRDDGTDGYAEALAAFDAALKLEPRSAEALFNRALTLERLGLAAAAREAWARYLEVDASSQWATEARAHQQRLAPAQGESRFRAEQPRLERAALDGDAATVTALVQQYPQAARSFAEAEYLGRWGEAVRIGDPATAARELTIARVVGAALGDRETLLRDAVRIIDASDAQTRPSLANAQIAYRRARIAYSRQAPAAAEPELRRAANAFAAAGDPMALVARYFAANTRFDQNDVAGARHELDALLADANAHPSYRALGAQVRWELALCAMNDDDWERALPLLQDSAQEFAVLGERSNRGFIETLLADVLVSLGRPAAGWAARIRSFEALSADGWGDRLAVSIGGAVRMELRGGRTAAARALSSIEREALRATGNDASLANALMRAAVLDAQAGEDDAALACASEAATAAGRLRDPEMRARSLVDVALAQGAALLRRDPRAAADALARAIDGYAATEAPLFLPESHLLRARALLRLRDEDGALQEVEHGTEAYERHRFRFTSTMGGTGVYDAGPALYREAIRLHLDRGETAAAFLANERALQQLATDTPPAGLDAVQRRIAGSGATLLALAMLDDEIATFAVTESGIEAWLRPVQERDVIRLGASACGGDLDAADALYELLIRPAEAQLAHASQLIVVASAPFDEVPFAALRDARSKQYLIERLPVAMAPSASALRRGVPAPAQTIVAVDAGSGGAALPASRAELAQVTRIYPRVLDAGGGRATFAAILGAAADADVIHVSGHADSRGPAGEATLVLGGEPVSSRRIAAAAPLSRGPVVVLAACETLRAIRSPRVRTLSLGDGFLAAGASDIIGTLAPIPDVDAQAIFERVHRHLAAGRTAAEALRLAQLESLAAEAGGTRNAWRSVALLTHRIASSKGES
jgi:tetratricopeptide (TPR) repeat protein